jgi:hypothetical protein
MLRNSPDSETGSRIFPGRLGSFPALILTTWLSIGCNLSEQGGTDTPNLPDKKEIVGKTEPLARIYVFGNLYIPEDPARLPQVQPKGIAAGSGLFRFYGSIDVSHSLVVLEEGGTGRKGCREDFYIPEDGLAWADPVLLDQPVAIQGSLIDLKKAMLDSLGGQDGLKLESWIGERGTVNYAKVDSQGRYRLENVCFQRKHLRILRAIRRPDGDLTSTPIAFDVPTCLPKQGHTVYADTVRIPASQPSGSLLPPLACE